MKRKKLERAAKKKLRRYGKTVSGHKIDTELLTVIMSQGFEDETLAAEALKQTDNNLDRAIHLLTSDIELLKMAVAKTKPPYVPPEEDIQKLISFGFTHSLASGTLKLTQGNFEVALDKLLSGQGQEDIIPVQPIIPPVVTDSPDTQNSEKSGDNMIVETEEEKEKREKEKKLADEAEYELIEEVRKLVPAVASWPDRYILIFLFARRHSIPHTVKLLNKHIQYCQSMGFKEITADNLYPFTPDQLTEEEFKLAFEGPLIYKHGLRDKHNRLLQIVRPRNWVQGRINMKRYISFVFWWHYYSWQHVPLAIHRNGIAVIIDMTNMGWANLDFSADAQSFITNAITCFPGRMRQGWLTNSGWILNTALTLLSYIISAKVMSRMVTVTQETLFENIDKEYVPAELGGTWKYDYRKDWYEKVLELDALKKQK